MSLILTGRPGARFSERLLFRPNSVALLAEPRLPEARTLARNLAGGGFKGTLMADGLSEAPFAPLEGAPDLAVIALPPEAQEAAIARVAAMGCRALVVPTAAPGLAAMVARHGMRALGERSFGLAVPGIGLNATLSHRPIPAGKLALMAQSSALARAALDWAAADGLGFTHVIGIGSNDDIGFALGLDWLARDARTACVMLEVRRIKSRRLFVSAARATARIRPVVALRPGERAAGASEVTDAVLRRAGVLHVSGFEEWVAAAETLARARARPGSGERVAVVANGLGLARLAADAVTEEGLSLAAFTPATEAALNLFLPEGWAARNPLSLGPGAGTRLAEAAAALAAAPDVDTVVALHAPTPEEDGAATLEAFRAAAQTNRGAPILLGWLGDPPGPEPALPLFPTPEAAARGALHLARERRNRAAASELPPAEVLQLRPDRAAAQRLLDAARAEGRDALREDEGFALLAAYGMPVAPYRTALTPEDAAAAAAMLGFPVALKALGTGLRHKSEKGGVVLNLREAKAVLEAAREMRERLGPASFLVQRMAARGSMELRIRVADDPMFGPWIGFGQGGGAADLAADEAFDLPPLNLPLAHALVARTRLSRLLPGWRERPPVSEPAIADSLVRISQLVVEQRWIAEFVVNPLMADAQGVLAVDAAVRLRPAGALSDLAILPYPAQLAAPFAAKDGGSYEIRPIRPEDAEAQGRFFRRLPPEDVRYRFFSAMRELPPALLARLTQIDYGREMALIATRAGETYGTVRIIREPNSDRAEFAVVVAPEAKGTGLARHLMERGMAWAREEGVREVVGHVLADNQPMLGFVRALGFRLARSPEDPEVMEASVSL
jgi:acetyltransferase